MAGVTTHVLDVSRGRPADGVRVELYELAGGSDRKLIADVVTNADGRTDKPLMSADQARAGQFELDLPCWRLFPPPARGTRRPAVPRHRADPLWGRRRQGALSRSPHCLALELFDLSGSLEDCGRRLVWSTGLGFLGASPFRGEFPHSEGWLPLDFLGFSRQNRDLSISYGHKAANVFLHALSHDTRGAGSGANGLGGWVSRIVHRASLILFLVFCNNLSPIPHFSAGSD